MTESEFNSETDQESCSSRIVLLWRCVRRFILFDVNVCAHGKMNKHIKTLSVLFILGLMVPREAMVSGQASGGVIGTLYHLNISGGPSSWNYEKIRRQDRVLQQWAEQANCQIHEFVAETIRSKKLPITTIENMENVEYCDGGIIESDATAMSVSDLDSKRNFERCLKNNKFQQGQIVVTTDMIPGTYYYVTLSYIVTQRVSRADIDYLSSGVIRILAQTRPANF